MKIFDERCEELEANSGILKNRFGSFYYKPGYVKHREDGPSDIWRCGGEKDWYYNDELIMETDGEVTSEQLKEFRLRIL